MQSNRAYSDQQIQRRVVMQQIKREFEDFQRNQETAATATAGPGFQTLLHDLANRNKCKRYTLAGLNRRSQPDPDTEPTQVNELHCKIRLIEHRTNERLIDIDSQLDIQKQLQQQLAALRQQVTNIRSECTPLLEAEKQFEQNVFLSREQCHRLDDFDRKTQSRLYQSVTDLGQIERSQKLYFQSQKQLLEKKHEERNRLKEDYADTLLKIQRLREFEARQAQHIASLTQDEEVKMIAREEKKVIVSHAYSLVKVKELCQHPSLFEEYIQLVEVDDPMESLNTSVISEDPQDVHSLFATAVKIRRRTNHILPKPRLKSRLTLNYVFDDESDMKRIAERCFIFENEDPSELADYLLEWFKEQESILRGLCLNFDTNNLAKSELITEIQEQDQQIAFLQSKQRECEISQTLFQPNLAYDNYNGRLMTYNIKSTSVETKLVIQKLEEKVKDSEALFFQLKSCIETFLFKLYQMIEFLQSNTRISSGLKDYLHDLNDIKVKQMKQNLLREKVYLADLERFSNLDEATLEGIRADILRENVMRQYLDEGILRHILRFLQRLAYESDDGSAMAWMKEQCFELLKGDITKTFDQYVLLYDLITKEAKSISTNICLEDHSFSKARFKVGESLMPSPSKSVQKTYQRAAAKISDYYNSREAPWSNRNKWRVQHMQSSTPWVNLLKNTTSLSYLGYDLPVRDKYLRGDDVGDLYLQAKNRATTSQSNIRQETSVNKTSENVFNRLHHYFDSDIDNQTKKELADQKERMAQLNEQDQHYQDSQSFKKLQQFLLQQKYQTNKLLVQANVRQDSKQKRRAFNYSVHSFQSSKKTNQTPTMPALSRQGSNMTFEIRRASGMRIQRQNTMLQHQMSRKLQISTPIMSEEGGMQVYTPI